MEILYEDILEELERAEAKFPKWPVDPLHAIGVLNEEIGELNQAVLQAVYEPVGIDSFVHVEEEAIQAAAMLFRFLKHMDKYEYKPSEQTSL